MEKAGRPDGTGVTLGAAIPAGTAGTAGTATAARTANKRSRKRSVLACQLCHMRKVRCNVMQVGPPCANCAQDGVQCEIVDKGRHRRRHRVVKLLSGEAASSQLSPQHELTITPEPTEADCLDYLEPSEPVEYIEFIEFPESTEFIEPPKLSEPPTRAAVPVDAAPKSHPHSHMPTPPASEPQGVDYGGLLDDDIDNDSTAILYIGEQQGLGFVVDICQPKGATTGSHHFVVPRAAAKDSADLLPEDMAALRAKGCFSLPSVAAQTVLLRCYFHHVHPFLPVLDAARFVREYEDGPHNINLLLLWSMFFAATNFLTPDELELAGHATHKEMKHAIYRRAKALYDADPDRNGSWHWIGIAISLCQTIGMHRTLLLEKRQQQNHHHQQAGPQLPLDKCHFHLWRLIWWTCYFRDTWLSYGMGRPTRISLEDCDTPLPTAGDLEDTWGADDVRMAATSYFPPAECQRRLALMYPHLMDTTFALGHILRTHYRASAAHADPIAHAANPLSCNHDWERLLRCRAAFLDESAPGSHDGSHDSSPVVLSHLYHLYIYYESCVVALYRPYLARRRAHSQSAQHTQPTQHTQYTVYALALQRAGIAATNINGLLNKMMASRLTEFCQPMMVTAIIPALQIHMFMTVSGSTLTARCLARHQLDICIIFLGELRRTYWAADLTYALFIKARKKLSTLWRGEAGPGLGSGPDMTLPFEAGDAAQTPTASSQTAGSNANSIDLDGMDMDLFLDDLFPAAQYDLLLGASPAWPGGGSGPGAGSMTDVNLLLDPDELASFAVPPIAVDTVNTVD
ncbi:fungal specific transcription factor [Ophiostoma piceae UAMH 11346]|uniref:Fungal specific transcription factor n=1 Tax=Ophiostoma piceae (strain UAMH 11346) TaxID=1262450 RepID=S3BZM5_OPHP1|nr:fungal specific transcription factor [Ophiostoma piceae UAMH 11346]